MSVLRPLLLLLSALPCLAATFGTVVSHPSSLADLVIDEPRRRLYVVNTASNQIEVYRTNVNPPSLQTTIKTDATPLSVAISRETPNPRYLYVTCYDGSTLDIIDLNSANFTSVSKQLDAKPQGVAVGFNGKVLITTIGTGTGAEVLITYDPVTGQTQPVVVAPPAPVAPTVPPPNSSWFLGGQEPAAGIAGRQADHRSESAGGDAHGVRLRCGVFDGAGQPRGADGFGDAGGFADGSRFLSGPMLFDTQTLAVVAQQNTTNSPYAFPANANFNTQTARAERTSCRMGRDCWRHTTLCRRRCRHCPPIPAN